MLGGMGSLGGALVAGILMVTVEDLVGVVVENVLRMFQLRRDFAAAPEQLISDLASLLVELEFYEERFEQQFVQQSSLFYSAYSERRRENLVLEDFVRKVETMFALERGHSEAFLLPKTAFELNRLLEEKLILNNLLSIFSDGFQTLLDRSDELYLHKLYLMIERVEKVDKLAAHYKDYISKKGSEVTQRTRERV